MSVSTASSAPGHLSRWLHTPSRSVSRHASISIIVSAIGVSSPVPGASLPADAQPAATTEMAMNNNLIPNGNIA